MADVFPARNLPGRAEEWGRTVEDSFDALAASRLDTSQGIDNWLRFSSGQLDSLSQRLDEVYNRSTEAQTLANIAVTGSATAEPYPRTNVNVTFSATPQSRRAFITLSGNVTSNASLGERMYVYLMYRGVVVSGAWAQPFAPSSTPVEWSNNAPVLVSGVINTVAGDPTEITVRAVRAADAFSAGTSTVTLISPIVSITRSGIV